MKTLEAIRAFSALAQETRLRAFRHLVQAGPEGLPAGQLAAELDIPPATLSFHLKELAAAGLVRSQRQSRLIVYSPNFDATRSLGDFLMENCCQRSADCSTGPKRKQRK